MTNNLHLHLHLHQQPQSMSSHTCYPPGAAAHPLFQFLQQKTGKECTWNFCKFVPLLLNPPPPVIYCNTLRSLTTINPFSVYPPEVDPYRLRDKIVSVIPYVYGR